MREVVSEVHDHRHAGEQQDDGEVDRNPWVDLRLGSHFALYPHSIFEYEAGDDEDGEPRPEATVRYTLYPIISPSHPCFAGFPDGESSNAPVPMVEAVLGPGGFENVDRFAVLVRTEKYETVGAIPDRVARIPHVEGLVINRIRSLDEKESELIRSSFPRLDLSRVLILDEGRRPMPSTHIEFLFGGAALLLTAGLGVLFWGLNRRSQAREVARKRSRAARSR